MQVGQPCVTLCRVRARGADQLPVHQEYSELGCVNEQVDRLAFRHILGLRKTEWIDPEEITVLGAAHQAFELGDDPRAPGPGLFQRHEPQIRSSRPAAASIGLSRDPRGRPKKEGALNSNVCRAFPAPTAPSGRHAVARKSSTRPRAGRRTASYGRREMVLEPHAAPRLGRDPHQTVGL